jgi:hypothetical protein
MELAAGGAAKGEGPAHIVLVAFGSAEPAAAARVEQKLAVQADKAPAAFEVEPAGRCAQALGLRSKFAASS